MYKNLWNLQLFATGDNNDLPVRNYQMDFKQLMQAVFQKQSVFGDFFGGSLEALDGVQNNETAFYVKTSDIPCVLGTGYDTGENVAFGTGTGADTRFGPRKEITYTNTPVLYDWGWNFHEGIDRYTVNNSFDAAVADRLELQARAKTQLFNAKHSLFIHNSAGEVMTSTEIITKDNVADVFNRLHKYFVEIGAVGTKVAKVNPDVYSAIIDSPLATTAKGSAVSIDDQGIAHYKGFAIQEIPSEYFQTVDGISDCIYAYITGVGKAFTGISTARSINSEDFDGVALQGAGKAGEYILPDNKKAVVRVIVNADYGLDNLTVTSIAGTASGDTKITVAPALTSGNSYKYKIADNAVLPAAGDSVKLWSVWDGTSDITAATGKEICVVECNANYEAVKGGVATVTAKA